MDSRFTVFGIGLVSITISYGAFLIAWAIAFSLVTESDSITSWIPAFLGLPILLGGVMTLLRPIVKSSVIVSQKSDHQETLRKAPPR